MKKLVSNLLLIAVISFGFASCNNAQKMIDAAEQIDIKCNPEVLEVIAGNIDATVSVTFPPEYFLPKATLEVTPVLLYIGGEAVGKPFVYQGEKVTDNYKTVTKAGATISEKVHFDYVPGMEKSELVGRIDHLLALTQEASPKAIAAMSKTLEINFFIKTFLFV